MKKFHAEQILVEVHQDHKEDTDTAIFHIGLTNQSTNESFQLLAQTDHSCN